MTKRATDAIGKAVVSAATGKKLGPVSDLLLGMPLGGRERRSRVSQGKFTGDVVEHIGRLEAATDPDLYIRKREGLQHRDEWQKDR